MSQLLDIIIPVYNADKFLDKCLESIVNCDGFAQFRLILIDDGSKDNSLDIIKNYAKKHTNIKVLSRENRGIVSTLNEALSLCNAKYIARMDADDIVLPSRFTLQLSYLEEHKDVSMVGTAFNIIDERGKLVGGSKPPVGLRKIKAYTLFGSPICHPSVMFRGDVVYNMQPLYKDEPLCEDYCLWLRMLSNFKIANVNITSLHYRVNEISLSHRDESKQVSNTLKYRDLRGLLNITPTSMTSLDNLFAPRVSNISSFQYFYSILKSMPTIIKSDLSLFWFLVYASNGLIIKLGIRE